MAVSFNVMLERRQLDLAPRSPTAALLSFSMLRFEFAASVRPQKFTGVKPVDGLCSSQYRRQDTAKFVIVRTAMPPKRTLCWRFAEAHHFLDAAITIRRDDEYRARQLVSRVDSEEQVMMKLSLLPVVENFVAAKPASYIFQQRTQPKILGKLFDDHQKLLCHSLKASAGASATAGPAPSDLDIQRRTSEGAERLTCRLQRLVSRRSGTTGVVRSFADP